MDATGYRGEGIERLIDSHTELCEFFDGKRAPASRAAPILVAPNSGKASAELLADLVDQALAACGGSDCADDPRLFALKIALTDAIMELA
jgi:hypothetical protein